MTNPKKGAPAPAADAPQIEIADETEVLAFGTAGAEPVSVSVKTDDPEDLDPRELLMTIRALGAQISELQAAQAETARKVDADYDMTDDFFFLARPPGERWEERRVVDKKTVLIEMVATAFYGPFSQKEDIEQYANMAVSGRASPRSYGARDEKTSEPSASASEGHGGAVAADGRVRGCRRMLLLEGHCLFQ